jgi:hypothetical protein
MSYCAQLIKYILNAVLGIAGYQPSLYQLNASVCHYLLTTRMSTDIAKCFLGQNCPS